jgi:hypothetical protein
MAERWSLTASGLSRQGWEGGVGLAGGVGLGGGPDSPFDSPLEFFI